MARAAVSVEAKERGMRSTQLRFRMDEETKLMVELAAALEGRSLTDYSVAMLREAAHQTIARHESLVLSGRDRTEFFDALIRAPKANARLRRVFRSARAWVRP
jgi:uncharacterized protein (DUF1778 family)